MNSTDIINYKILGFDNEKYFELQKQKILERIENFKEGTLYLEVGGKFPYDPHAARVLPGLKSEVKRQIFEDMKDMLDIIFCMKAEDIATNRQLTNKNRSYQTVALEKLREVEEKIGVKPKIAINLCTIENLRQIDSFHNQLTALGYKVAKRYFIPGYPHNTDTVLSEKGFGKDEHLQVNKKLVLVISVAADGGKMSTCLGQIYLDQVNGMKSGYAKFETFPIWNLPLEHPVNLAYEAATADGGDYNMKDQYHFDAYGIESVNYNRDLDAFEILRNLSQRFVPKDSFMRNYKSPTDMGINYAGFAITNDEVVAVASLNEIRRRRGWFQEVVDRGQGDVKWVERCDELEKKALEYIKIKLYNPNLSLV